MKTWFIKSQKDLACVVGLIALAALYRVLPHPYNFAPVAAIAIFGGASFKNRLLAVAVPLIAMLLSDAVIGFQSQGVTVYLSFALIALASGFINRELQWTRIVGTSVAGSLFFFVVTNFEVWARSGMYARNFEGLTQCYVMALPFFQGTFMGDLIFTVAMFGIYALSTQRFARVSV
jgi:hypothetical protein